MSEHVIVERQGAAQIIRMNRGLLLAADPANGVGTRTDILFHNLKEAGPRSRSPARFSSSRSTGKRCA